MFFSGTQSQFRAYSLGINQVHSLTAVLLLYWMTSWQLLTTSVRC